MRRDLIIRALVALVALVAVLVGAPRPVAGVLAGLALLLSGERLARLRESGRLDQLLLVVGGSVVALVLTGMVLGITGVPLRGTTWVVAVSVLSLVGLALAARRAPVPREPSRRSGVALRLAPWLLVSALVVTAAVVVSVRSLDAVDERPLQMSFGRVEGTKVSVVVTSGARTGPLELRASTPAGDDLSYPLITLRPGRPVTTTVALPAAGRYVITLNNPEQTRPLRTLVLDR